MTVPKLPPHTRPVTTAAPSPALAADAGADVPAGKSVPLTLAGLMLGLGAMLLAGAAAYALASWFGGTTQWAAALAAVFGMALAALPLAWLMWKLARDGALDTPPADTVLAGQPRDLFMQLAEREWARSRRYGTGAALLLVDVDRYPRLCEARGVDAGDAVLAELLQQTAPTLRGADLLTRFATPQMAVFLAQADATGALDVAERIRDRAEQLEVPFDHTPGGPMRLRLTVSVGVAHLRAAHQNVQALIDDAEDAVAAARQAGGNCVRAAPVDTAPGKPPGSWRERRARPKQGGNGS